VVLYCRKYKNYIFKSEGDYLSKLSEEDKAFEQSLKGKMGWKCSCSLDVVDKKCSLKEVVCKKCGKNFKTNRNTDYCFDCEKKIK
jgi:hypothetical protein